MSDKKTKAFINKESLLKVLELSKIPLEKINEETEISISKLKAEEYMYLDELKKLGAYLKVPCLLFYGNVKHIENNFTRIFKYRISNTVCMNCHSESALIMEAMYINMVSPDNKYNVLCLNCLKYYELYEMYEIELWR